MKPYGREKTVVGGVAWKKDGHFHPKHSIRNWWECICEVLPRSTMKQKWKKDASIEINSNKE